MGWRNRYSIKVSYARHHTSDLITAQENDRVNGEPSIYLFRSTDQARTGAEGLSVVFLRSLKAALTVYVRSV